MSEPCIGLLEFSSLAAGIEATDAMLKEAPVKGLMSRSVCPGKWFVLISGAVDDVRSSMRAGRTGHEEVLVDEFILPNVHPTVFAAMSSMSKVDELDALGVIETFSVASTVFAADVAVKRANVRLIDIRLANGLGGKSYVTLTGEVSDVRSAVQAAAQSARDKGVLTREIVIPRPHENLRDFLV
ncbi:MAG: BMC domain-containing protein [Planctomycetes bacterium]|nr:BMC domain-containing protein [Planctomycetota bacterium]